MVKNKITTCSQPKLRQEYVENVPNRQNMTLTKTRTLLWQQCHALHHCPNSNDGAKEDDDNGPAGSIGCSNHFGSVGALMGSGTMTMTTTKIDDDACPPQVLIAV
jgi:hypothetical protein